MQRCVWQALLPIVLVLAISSSRLLAAPKDEPILIGAVHSLSSWGAVAGQGELHAITLAVEDINRAGGVLGRPLKIISEDNSSLLKGVVTAFNKLANVDKVPVVLGPNWSEFAEVMAPLAQKKSVVMLVSSGYSKALTSGKEYVFTLLPGYEVVTKPLAEHIYKSNFAKIALVVTENAYFEGLSKALQDHLRKSGAPVFRVENAKSDTQDYRTTISKLKSDGVDAVVMLLSESGENAAFLKQAHELAFKAQIFGSNAVSYDSVLMKNRAIGNGIIYFDYVTVATDEFIARYKAKFGEKPYFSSPQAYDSVFLIKGAIERCGLRASEIKQCLQNVQYSGVSGPIQFDSQRQIIRVDEITALFRIVDGEPKKIQVDR